MKLQMTVLLLSALVMSSSFSEGKRSLDLRNQTAVARPLKTPFKEYHLTGTMTVGIITYAYDIVVDATICITCQPPRITINSVNSVTICVQRTTICGSASFTRTINDNQGYTQKVEFSSNDLDPDILDYLNSESFVDDLRTENYIKETN